MQPPDVRLYLDALTCAVVLAREARLTENDDLHFYALSAQGLLVDALRKIPEIAPFKDQIFKRILEVRGPAVYILPWPDNEEDLARMAKRGRSGNRAKHNAL